VVIDLAAEALHGHVDDIGLGVKLVAPNALAKKGARQHAAGAAEKRFEQSKFAGGEFDGLAGPTDRALMQIENQVGVGEHGERLASATSHDGAKTSDKFNDRKRFRQVIIGAEFQTFDAFVHVATGTE